MHKTRAIHKHIDVEEKKKDTISLVVNVWAWVYNASLSLRAVEKHHIWREDKTKTNSGNNSNNIDTNSNNENLYANVEATKSMRYVVAGFFFVCFVISLRLFLFLSHLITIVMNLWLHRCQWLVSFLCSFFVMPVQNANYVCVDMVFVFEWAWWMYVCPLIITGSCADEQIMVRINCFMLSYDL